VQEHHPTEVSLQGRQEQRGVHGHPRHPRRAGSTGRGHRVRALASVAAAVTWSVSSPVNGRGGRAAVRGGQLRATGPGVRRRSPRSRSSRRSWASSRPSASSAGVEVSTASTRAVRSSCGSSPVRRGSDGDRDDLVVALLSVGEGEPAVDLRACQPR